MGETRRENVWNALPLGGEEWNGIKLGDSFCFIETTDTEKFFIKEYLYSATVIERYHALQRFIAQAICHKDIQLDGSRIVVLGLPSLSDCTIPKTLQDAACAVRIPYIEGQPVNPKKIEDITQLIRQAVPCLKIQRIQASNCHEQPDGTIIITDVAWDIPTFLLDNPSGNLELDHIVAQTQEVWSQIMYATYPMARD